MSGNQTYIQYSEDIETIDPGESEVFDDIIATMTRES